MSREQYNKLNDLLQQELKDLRERTHKMSEDLDKCGRPQKLSYAWIKLLILSIGQRLNKIT